MPCCNGIKKNGEACTSVCLVKGTGYCNAHKDQAQCDFAACAVPAVDTTPDSHICNEKAGPKTPTPESPKKVAVPKKQPTKKTVKKQTTGVAPPNPSPFARPPTVKSTPPSDVRDPDAKTKCPTDAGAKYAPLRRRSVAAGINGTSADSTSYAGGWIGMLRDLATRDTASSSDFDFKALAALHRGLTTCCAEGCTSGAGGLPGEATKGAHVWIWRQDRGDGTPGYDTRLAYIVPTCTHHNGRDFDFPKDGLLIPEGTPAMSMLPRLDYVDYIR